MLASQHQYCSLFMMPGIVQHETGIKMAPVFVYSKQSKTGPPPSPPQPTQLKFLYESMIATDLLEIDGLGGCTGASPFTMEGVLPVINNRPCYQ